MTILAAFHPGRGGIERGDTGFSTHFEDAPRAVIKIGPNYKPMAKGSRVREEDGTYTYHVAKFNKGPHGQRIVFSYVDGLLMAEDRTEQSAAGRMQCIEAVETVVLRWTYRDDRGAVLLPDLPDEEREEIERRHKERIQLAPGFPAMRDLYFGGQKLIPEHNMIVEYAQAIGERSLPHALASFTNLILGDGLLPNIAYRRADAGVSSTKRMPTGFYCSPVAVDVDEADDEADE